MARKRVKAIKGGDDGVKSMMNHFNYTGPANFENAEVQVSILIENKQTYRESEVNLEILTMKENLQIWGLENSVNKSV